MEIKIVVVACLFFTVCLDRYFAHKEKMQLFKIQEQQNKLMEEIGNNGHPKQKDQTKRKG